MTIPVLGEGGPRNPLLVLASAVAEQTDVLREIARNTGHKHEYALMDTPEGGWLTYCMACSDAEQRLVHPCKVLDPLTHNVPPAAFTTAPTGLQLPNGAAPGDSPS